MVKHALSPRWSAQPKIRNRKCSHVAISKRSAGRERTQRQNQVGVSGNAMHLTSRQRTRGNFPHQSSATLFASAATTSLAIPAAAVAFMATRAATRPRCSALALAPRLRNHWCAVCTAHHRLQPWPHHNPPPSCIGVFLAEPPSPPTLAHSRISRRVCRPSPPTLRASVSPTSLQPGHNPNTS
jgi:hypothetical protein